MTPNARLRIGIVLLITGLILPLGIYPLSATSLPTPIKTALGGIMFFGFELMAIPAIAIMGKENFDRIVAKITQYFHFLKPAGNISTFRHRVGIILFFIPLLPTYIMAYAPEWLPDTSPYRLWINISSDLIFLVSLFILGGDFWDKLRALFTKDARAHFPDDSNHKKH